MIIHPPPTASGSTPRSFRIKRGSKLADLPPQSPDDVPPLSTLDGPFQLAEYLALRVKADPHNLPPLVNVPDQDKSADKDVWLYEHLRRIPIDLAPLIAYLLPMCTRQSCPEMKAGEWLYLCVAHEGGQATDCCAIDYILHTLDTTTAILNTTENFPSRLSVPPASLAHFPSHFRRLSRIFAHAYFHHREAFQLAENENSLYARFALLCDKYKMVEQGLLPIPPDHSSQADAATEEENAAEGDGEAEADQEEPEDESDESDEDDDHAHRPRGREKDDKDGDGPGGTRRPHSLDRHAGPHEDLRPASTAAVAGVKSGVSDTPPWASAVKGSLKGDVRGGTQARGKQARGTMLWSSEPDVEPEPSAPTTGTSTTDSPLERTESIESAIHMPSVAEAAAEPEGPSHVAASAATVQSSADEPVPKDEIELLEERGEIPVEPSVSPLPTAAEAAAAPALSAGTSETASSESTSPHDADGMVDVKLEDEPVPSATEPSVGVALAAPPPVSPSTPSKPVPVSPSANGSSKTHKTSSPPGASPMKKAVASSPLAQVTSAEPEREDINGVKETDED